MPSLRCHPDNVSWFGVVAGGAILLPPSQPRNLRVFHGCCLTRSFECCGQLRAVRSIRKRRKYTPEQRRLSLRESEASRSWLRTLQAIPSNCLSRSCLKLGSNRANNRNSGYPLTGVFSTRSPDRPNPLGLHRAKVLAIYATSGLVA